MNHALWQLDHVTLGNRLRDVSLSIQPGVTAVLGPSGAGKTSLLNLLVGFERASQGKIDSHVERGKFRLPIFWVPPDSGLWPHLTVEEHLRQVGAAPDGLLSSFDLDQQRQCRPDTLSQGERSRLAVARALAADGAVLVMDEPLVHVDPSRVGKYWEVIRRWIQDRNVSLIFATHSPQTVLAEAQRVICLRDGAMVFNGDVEELYWRPSSPELAECLGESNWLEPADSRLWLQRDTAVARCLRPEQIQVQTEASAPFVVEASRFQGFVAEVLLRDEKTGTTRRFFHRPSTNHLLPGTHVLLKALAALLMCVHLAGCQHSKEEASLFAREVHSWSVPSSGALQPAARSLTINNEGDVVALDTAGRVLTYGLDGKVKRQWSMPDTKIGKPEGVCVLKDGRVVVCDTHYHQVVIFDAKGGVAKIFGKEGNAQGEFIYPVAVTKDAQENLYIAEYGGNDRVQKFTSEGKFILAFGTFGTAPGQFQRPSGVAWHGGKIYVADAFNNRLQLFTDDGKFVQVLDPKDQPPGLKLPYDIKLGADGALYVIEYGGQRISKVTLEGKLLGRYGQPGSGTGHFATPWGLAVDAKGAVYVADTGNRRIVEVQLN